jgi:ABC-type uncharacterized transport system, periplasmic component
MKHLRSIKRALRFLRLPRTQNPHEFLEEGTAVDDSTQGRAKMKKTEIYARFAIVLVVISMVGTPASLIGAELRNARIGILTPGLTFGAVHEGMTEGLAQLGYSEGKNITFVIEDTKGNTSDLPARAAKLMAAKPDLLFAATIPHTMAAKQSTSILPIVFTWVNEPVAAGVTQHFPYSKSNLTGVASIIEILSGKRLEVLLEVAPKAKRLLVIVAAKESVSVSSIRSLEIAAEKFRIQLVRRDVTNRDEIIKALEKTPRGSVDAIFFIPSLLVRTNLDLLVQRAGQDRIPLAVSEEAVMDSGALLSYGPNQRLVGLQAAGIVNKILKGGSPGEIMIETPDRFFLAINQRAAQQIGLHISRGMLERADRLIQ